MTNMVVLTIIILTPSLYEARLGEMGGGGRGELNEGVVMDRCVIVIYLACPLQITSLYMLKHGVRLCAILT